ncbi:MAG: 50S ribosomal protein L20 [Candidatus Taylorbacteria bacterium CG11_big_fil_rev_8_21_14_0_20_46_11]|uniref:Large ribosomal subunit protein bL20 n=1 Tax=Candidatus Taylorbacteria bacterium CG11_big_fil_rev_8_21_14_0_20_46_11 TaxID=1975025 RepID=A0A2H0K9Y8_9BACT|nr:MAG: 50S ribosomal protein L20 [Candidatus Taylorbacteria bacterium CG11_big_fil_rev_8_21_14_0_20_46_11]
MSRVKKGVNALKFRRTLLKKTKGYRHGRSTKESIAWEAYVHAGKYSFAHRKDKKADFRTLWNIRLNAAVRPHGLSYSKFIGAMTKKGIKLNRKVLTEIAAVSPESFARIVEQVK